VLSTSGSFRASSISTTLTPNSQSSRERKILSTTLLSGKLEVREPLALVTATRLDRLSRPVLV
jgi:hypothetical protein